MEPQVPVLLTIAQVSRALAVSRRTVTDLISSGDLPALKLNDAPNASVRVRLVDFEDFLERRLAAKTRSTGFTSPEAVA